MSVQDDRDIDSATHNNAGDTAVGDGMAGKYRFLKT